MINGAHFFRFVPNSLVDVSQRRMNIINYGHVCCILKFDNWNAINKRSNVNMQSSRSKEQLTVSFNPFVVPVVFCACKKRFAYFGLRRLYAEELHSAGVEAFAYFLWQLGMWDGVSTKSQRGDIFSNGAKLIGRRDKRQQSNSHLPLYCLFVSRNSCSINDGMHHHQRNSQLLSADTFCGPSYLCYRPRYVTIVCMYARIAWVNFYTNSITIPAFVTLKLTDQAHEEGGGVTCVSRRAKNMWRICNYLLARKVAALRRHCTLCILAELLLMMMTSYYTHS